MDYGSMTLTVLLAVGAVNVVLLFQPNIDARWKFVISFVAAFIAFFIPANLGNLILNAAKDAIAAAIVGSGVYKIATKAGGR